MQDNAGIERARPSPHAKSIQRGEAHTAIDTFPVFQSAQAGAAPQMSDYNASVGNLWRNLRHDIGNVLVRQSMEAISLDSTLADFEWQRYQIYNRRVTAMKAGVKA